MPEAKFVSTCRRLVVVFKLRQRDNDRGKVILDGRVCKGFTKPEAKSEMIAFVSSDMAGGVNLAIISTMTPGAKSTPACQRQI